MRKESTVNRRKTAWRLAVADDIDFGEGIAFSKSDYSHAALSISPLFCGHYLSIYRQSKWGLPSSYHGGPLKISTLRRSITVTGCRFYSELVKTLQKFPFFFRSAVKNI